MFKWLFSKFGYVEGMELYSNYRRPCGLWLLIIGFVMILATVFGGSLVVNPVIFTAGYAIGFYVSHVNVTMVKKLAAGEMHDVQAHMSLIGIIALGILMFLFGGPFFIGWQWRNIWLGAMLACGLHFLLFYVVHGSSMRILAAAGIVIALGGFLFPTIPFIYFGILDGVSKLFIGGYLFWKKEPQRIFLS